MKRFLLCLAVFLSFCFLFSACGEDTPAQTTTEQNDTTAPLTDPVPEKLVIASKAVGKTDYWIVIAKEANSELNSAALDLRTACFSETDCMLWVKRDANEEPRECEILLGETNRPESAQAAEGLAPNQYRIVLIGKKLVVAGGSRSAVLAAVSLLNRDYFAECGEEASVPVGLDLRGEIDLRSVTDLVAGWNAMTFEAENGVDLLYQIWLPKGYSAEKEYPCILYMHSAGVRCDDNSHINTGEAKFLRNFEASKYANEAIVIAPCCPKTEKWVQASSWNQITYNWINTTPTRYMTATLELFAYYREQLAIDEARLYTYGMSMGGFAVWDLLTRNPGVFAAAIPVAGAGDPKAVEGMAGTAIWCFHGSADTVVPVESSRKMMAAFEAIGRNDVKYTEFQGAGHGIWAQTADTAGLFDWMFEQKLEK